MQQTLYTVTENKNIAEAVYKMTLSGDTSAISAPGQFINIKLDGFFLRRPISVYDWTEHSLTVIYKAVGTGTEAMSRIPAGTTLDILAGLGNGYDTSKSGANPLLIGGGVGVPPLFALCKKLLAEGKHPSVILGFNNIKDVFCEKEFLALGVPVSVVTVDGSYATKGFVTDIMNRTQYSYFYTCGPLPMFRAIEAEARTSGQYSFEERMGCGFGACMGCTCKTLYGNKRICKDGPVLEREEVIWQTQE